ncbi:MAG: SH3 domain-containing protein [Chloroflexi bacterium]|nr:SH3 domain-containing protein [Chloroflexota bacterium]
MPKGLSGQRRIYSDVTYTLNADCQQSWRLVCGTSTQGAQKITITVNGGGNTISAFQDSSGYLDVFSLTGNCALSLNNVTINGGGYQGRAAIQLTNSDYASSFSNVTFTNTYYSALSFDDQRENNSPGTTHTLSNVLIKDTSGSYVVARHGVPSGIQAIGTVNLNINNLTLRNVRGGNSAIGANDTFIVGRTVSLGTITLTGCLTIDGVFPRVIYGNFVKTSTGACSGPVGNGGSSAIQYPQAPVSSCGLPLSGFIYGKHVYNLKSDCAMSGTLYIPYESDVVINGNRNAIVGGTIAVAGDFSLKNAVMSGATGSPVVSYLDKRMSIANAIFHDNMGPLHIQDSIFTLEKALIENHSVMSEASPSAVLVSKLAQVTIRDSVFRGNTGGQGAINGGAKSFSHGNSASTLAGCITFENNSPVDIFDPNSLLTDNRTGPCPPGMTFLGKPSRVPNKDESDESDESPVYITLRPSGGCDMKAGAIAMGSVACVFRHDIQLAVYGIDERSRGFFMVAATQPQIDAAGAGMVAASSDDRAAIFATADDNVMVSVGPDHESKVLHVVLEGGVHGRVISFTTTYGPSPGKVIAAAAHSGARALQDCMVTTRNILNFRDAPAGAVMGMLPYNVTLTVIERRAGWYKVDYHGKGGWLSADYVTPWGSCG